MASKIFIEYGIHSFLEQKRVKDKIQAVKNFKKEFDIWPQDNFNKFASWVDKGIRNGSIDGQPIKTLTVATQQHIEEEKSFRYYANRTPQEHFQLHKLAKENKIPSNRNPYVNIGICLRKFFDKYSLSYQQNIEVDGNCPKAYLMGNWYKVIIENNLQEQFKSFCNNEEQHILSTSGSNETC